MEKLNLKGVFKGDQCPMILYIYLQLLLVNLIQHCWIKLISLKQLLIPNFWALFNIYCSFLQSTNTFVWNNLHFWTWNPWSVLFGLPWFTIQHVNILYNIELLYFFFWQLLFLCKVSNLVICIRHLILCSAGESYLGLSKWWQCSFLGELSPSAVKFMM